MLAAGALVMLQMAYLIPQCDMAPLNTMGEGEELWAGQGYVWCIRVRCRFIASKPQIGGSSRTHCLLPSPTIFCSNADAPAAQTLAVRGGGFTFPTPWCAQVQRGASATEVNMSLFIGFPGLYERPLSFAYCPGFDLQMLETYWITQPHHLASAVLFCVSPFPPPSYK